MNKWVISVLIAFCLCMVGTVECKGEPNEATIEKILLDNYECFATVEDYLITSGYGDAYITKADGTVSSNFKRYKISRTDVNSAIQELFSMGCYYISLDPEDNCIAFGLWSSSQEKDCGVMCSINGKEPTVQFMTERRQLSKEGWYYFREDYNEWRQKNKE